MNYQRTGFGIGGHLTPAVKNILFANGIIFLMSVLNRQLGYYLSSAFALQAYDVLYQFKIWQLVTYMFLHGDFWHIFFNMFVFWMFGTELEMEWGSKQFLKYYFICGIGAGLINILLTSSDPSYPAGIMGLVAGRLAEEYYRPVLVIRTGDRYCGGSSRSIPEFNMIEALTKCGHLLTHFGGHSRAAGLSLYTRNLPKLEQSLLEIAAEELEGVDLRPKIDIDAETTLPDLGGNTYPTIQKMAPFGQGNPVPTFLCKQVEVVSSSTMGSDNSHLRMKVRQGTMLFDAVGFGLGNYIDEISSSIDIVFNLEMDHWNGQSKLRLNVLDFEPTSL